MLYSRPLFWHFKVFWWEQSSLAGPGAHPASCSFGYLGQSQLIAQLVTLKEATMKKVRSYCQGCHSYPWVLIFISACAPLLRWTTTQLVCLPNSASVLLTSYSHHGQVGLLLHLPHQDGHLLSGGPETAQAKDPADTSTWATWGLLQVSPRAYSQPMSLGYFTAPQLTPMLWQIP